MAVCEFRSNDDGYVAWLAGHRDGFVVNILPSCSPNGARLHRAQCRTINGRPTRGGNWTSPYMKVCADNLAEVQQWEIHQAGELIVRCGICRPAGGTGLARRAAEQVSAAVTVAPAADERFVIQGPTSGGGAVEAWSADYILFERRPPWQERLRNEIRGRCAEFNPGPNEVLHAAFCGPKLANADVENLAIYNIGSFKESGRNGIRFEHGSTVPQAPGGSVYRFSYRYELASSEGSFAHWQKGQPLAAFGWTGLGAFAGEKKLAQVWLALSRGKIDVVERAKPDTPFGVRVEVRPPYGREPVWGGLLKGIFDGVICALQAHTGELVATEVLDRLAEYFRAQNLTVEPAELEALLRDERSAVLGGVPRLVSPYRSGVKWDPSDHFCVAGELLAVPSEPGDDQWSMRGEVFELAR